MKPPPFPECGAIRGHVIGFNDSSRDDAVTAALAEARVALWNDLWTRFLKTEKLEIALGRIEKLASETRKTKDVLEARRCLLRINNIAERTRK
jgi:hypothetical protein